MAEARPQNQAITVEAFYAENKKRLQLNLISKRNRFDKKITDKELHRPGLALAGYTDLFTYHRIQICGNTEVTYLQKLSPEEREKSLRRLFSFDIPCVVVTSEFEVVPEIVQLADEYQITVFRTPYPTTKCIQLLHDYLDEKFAPLIHIHGSMVDVYGVGVLITGRSGIGKSEVALDLISRGHPLVADDVVPIVLRSESTLIAQVNEALRYHMEIRGLGIIDIQAMFGIRGIRKEKKVEVQVELVDWEKTEKYERLGIQEITNEILGIKIPLVRLPIYPGKNISMIVEVIALNQRLKSFGYNAALEFEERLLKHMKGPSTLPILDPHFE